MNIDYIQKQDEAVHAVVVGEEKRQAQGLELIPSENYVSQAVLEANGSVLTNKYSEGYPGRRYYGGQEFTDAVENIAIERAKELFGADHANVQPLTGAVANMGAFAAWCDLGDTILGMHLGHGGHLTHGHPVTHMAKMFNFIRYEMKDPDTGEIDYDQMRELALEHKPKIVLAGFSAYSREIDYARMSEIANEVGAIAVADIAHIAGLIAGGALANPFDHGFHMMTTTTHKTLRGPRGGMILTKGNVGNPLKKTEKTMENLPTLVDRSVFPGLQGGPIMNLIAGKAVAFGEALHPNFKEYAKQVLKNAKAMEEVFRNEDIRMIGGGTSNHLLLLDVFSSLNIGGKEAEEVLDSVGITLNKNAIADDTRSPFDPSGIRLGTPAITTRGFKEEDSKRVAELIVHTLRNKDDQQKRSAVHEEIKAMAERLPIPESFV